MAIIPACGLSRRMGEHKLLLPYGQSTVIGSLIASLSHPEIASVQVVCRGSDQRLQDEVLRRGGTPVIPPEDSREMRASVEFALNRCETQGNYGDLEGWILAPGDHPGVGASTIRDLFAQWGKTRSDILIPTYSGKRGHPTLFRWNTIKGVREIPLGHGLNWLSRESNLSVSEMEIGDPRIGENLNTPDDYKRLIDGGGSRVNHVENE